MKAAIPSLKLNDGHSIPVYGFGTFQIPADGSTYKAVREALELGIRHIDTAVAYFNEEEVGRAIHESGIRREEIFVTSKLWLQDYETSAAEKGLALSLKKLGLDYIDLYLLHQPYGEVKNAWKVLEKGKEKGLIRSIGVSNMTPAIWQKFVPGFDVKPAVNQVEFNPYFQQRPLRKLLSETGTLLEAWGPLGRGSSELLNDPVILKIAAAHGKDAGQIILRSEVQDGIIVFPKSVNPARIRSNMEIFDFELTDAEMESIHGLDRGHGSHDPDAPGVGEWLLANFDVHKDE